MQNLLEARPEVEAAWLAGSLGTNGGDRFSDVDLLVLIRDGMIGAAPDALADGLSAIAMPVLLNKLFGGRVINVVTEDWERFDLTLVQGEELARYDANALTPLFNKGDHAPPARPPIEYRPSTDALRKLVDEFLRVLGLATVVAGREEYALALSGIEHLRRLTFDLMLEQNAVAPWQRGGALHRNPLLTAEQRQGMSALLPLSANRESVIEGHRAFAALFLPRARALAAEIGMDWPEAFEAATRRHLADTLGLKF